MTDRTAGHLHDSDGTHMRTDAEIQARDKLLVAVDTLCQFVFEQRGDYTLERYMALKGEILAVIDEQPQGAI
jgi:hypothetical protein